MRYHHSLLALCVVGFSQMAFPCTTIVVGKMLTAGKSIIFAHNEDMGSESVGRLWHVPGTSYPSISSLFVPYETIVRPKATLSYWASGNPQSAQGLGTSKEQLPYDSVLVGLNERSVMMSCNWAYSKEANSEKKGIRRYAIRQLILERALTAKGGVELIGRLIEEYGQADWGGLVYVLADPDEAWVVETTTNHWVAKRIGDDEIWVTANRFRIGADYTLSSKGLIKDAKKNGWSDGPFNFALAYGDPTKMNQDYDRDRERRVATMLDGHKGDISIEHLFSVLRDRYEETDKFTPPQQFEVWRDEINKKPGLHRTINTNITQSSSVTLLRKDAPFGAVMWYSMATPSSSGYFPIYARGNKTPAPFSNNESTNSSRSAWWTFRNLQQLMDKNKFQPEVRQAFQDLYVEQKKRWRSMEKNSLQLHSQGKTKQSYEAMNNFCLKEADNTLTVAKRLIHDLQKKSP